MIDSWSRHPYATSGLVAALTVGFLAWVPDAGSAVRSGDGVALYSAVLAVAAALAALGLIPISIVLGLSSPRVKYLTRAKSADLRRTVGLAVGWHLLTIVVSVLLLALDSAGDPMRWGRTAAVALLVVGAEATLRALVEFIAILRLESETAQSVGTAEPLPDDWAESLLPQRDTSNGPGG